MAIGCSVDVPVGAVVNVTEDTTALPAGYLPVENPIVTALPAEADLPERALSMCSKPSNCPRRFFTGALSRRFRPIQVANCTVVPPEPSAVPVEGCESALALASR